MHVPHTRQFAAGGLMCLTHEVGHMMRMDVKNPARGGDVLAKPVTGFPPAICAGYFLQRNQNGVFWGGKGGLFVAPWDGSKRGEVKRRGDVPQLAMVTCLAEVDGNVYAGGVNAHSQAVVYCLDDRQKGTYQLGAPLGEHWKTLDAGRGVRALALGPNKTLIAAAADGVFSWDGKTWNPTRSWAKFVRTLRLGFPTHVAAGGRNDEVLVATGAGLVQGNSAGDSWLVNPKAPSPLERVFMLENFLVVIQRSGPSYAQTYLVWVRDRFGDKWTRRGELQFTPDCCVELDRWSAVFSGRWPWDTYKEYAVGVVALN